MVDNFYLMSRKVDDVTIQRCPKRNELQIVVAITQRRLSLVEGKNTDTQRHHQVLRSAGFRRLAARFGVAPVLS